MPPREGERGRHAISASGVRNPSASLANSRFDLGNCIRRAPETRGIAWVEHGEIIVMISDSEDIRRCDSLESA